MAKAYPYFKWYPKDAESDEKYAAMTDTELGFFHRCLNRSWMNEGLPADPEERWLVLKTPPDIAAKLWRRVGRSFVTSDLFPGKLVNPRQEIERAIATRKSKNNTAAAEKRWHPTPPIPDAAGDANALPIVLPTHTNGKTSQADIDEVCAAYDRHLKHNRKEPRDVVVQHVLSMNGKLDWPKFRSNHAAYCDHYAEHGWDFCTLTLLGWINAGMPTPPPAKKRVTSERAEANRKALMED